MMKSILFVFTMVTLLCYGQNKTLPAPSKSHMRFSDVVGWGANEKPTAPPGFTVSLYAEGFDNPRWLYQTPSGDVLVAESNGEHTLIEKIGAPIVGANKSNDLRKSADRITILRDADGDGHPEIKQSFITGLNEPFGMLVLGDYLYVANTDAVVRFPFHSGALAIPEAPQQVANLPAGKANRHWTRNIITNSDQSKIFIAVGSPDDHSEKGSDKDTNRACILEMHPDGSHLQVYASGLRNPVGMGFAPGTTTLYAAVNERDQLGDELVPDYFTSIKDGGFYGWPYSYFGDHMDLRVKEQRPELVKTAIVPDVALGAHTASLGLSFYTASRFPAHYQGGAFIAQHGSYNRRALSGYKVIFIAFKNGKPSGSPEDFLTGFVKEPTGKQVRGRPVCVLMLKDGSLLVTDDKSNKIWRVAYGK